MLLVNDEPARRVVPLEVDHIVDQRMEYHRLAGVRGFPTEMLESSLVYDLIFSAVFSLGIKNNVEC